MDSLSFTFQSVLTSNLDSVRHLKIHGKVSTIGGATARNVCVNFQLINRRLNSVQSRCSFSNPQNQEAEEIEGSVEEVRVPDVWLNSAKALEVIWYFD